LFEEFAKVLRVKDPEREASARRRLESWTSEVKASGIAELKAFAVKLLQDTEAVVAAIESPYSQGQTEGRVNKLKLIKRSMHGLGKFNVEAARCTPRQLESSACYPAAQP